MPEISVLIPTYNRASLLSQTVQSALAQTGVDHEVIVVDDGSTDDSQSLLEALGPRTRCFRQENRGVSSARNCALRQSSAEFVLFLDSDDLLLPGALATLSAFLHHHPTVDVVHSDGYIVDAEANPIGTLSAYRGAPPRHTLDAFVLKPRIHLASCLMRRAALDLMEGPFDEKMIGYEDWDLFVRLMAQGARFDYLATLTCCYRIHGQNKSAPKSSVADRRRTSLVYSRRRMMNSDWFASLQQATRGQFLFDLLTGALSGDSKGQSEVLADSAFRRLPAAVRSRLLYYVAVENLLAGCDRSVVRRLLQESIATHPANVRPYLLLATFPAGPKLQSLIIRSRRSIAQRGKPDPVIEALRRTGAA